MRDTRGAVHVPVKLARTSGEGGLIPRSREMLLCESVLLEPVFEAEKTDSMAAGMVERDKYDKQKA